MALRRIQGVLALEPDRFQPATHAVKIELIERFKAPVEVGHQRPFIGTDKAQQRFIAFHLDGRAIVGKQGQCRRRLQAHRRPFDLTLGMIGVAFDLDTSNLLDGTGFAA